MDKPFLENCLAEGMSLEQIGELAGKHPSTVSYWLKKHGLRANGADRHSPKRSIDPARVQELAEAGATIREICEQLGAGYSSVRYWIVKLGISTERMDRLRAFEQARQKGLTQVYAKCRHHGYTAFFKRKDGAFRCLQCSSAAVAARRRRVKKTLIRESGGGCAVCGYDRHPSALHFHHLDPAQKAFTVSRRGVTRSIEEVREEARKCVLLCANCHAEVEAGALDVSPDEGRYSDGERSEGVKTPK